MFKIKPTVKVNNKWNDFILFYFIINLKLFMYYLSIIIRLVYFYFLVMEDWQKAKDMGPKPWWPWSIYETVFMCSFSIARHCATQCYVLLLLLLLFYFCFLGGYYMMHNLALPKVQNEFSTTFIEFFSSWDTVMVLYLEVSHAKVEAMQPLVVPLCTLGFCTLIYILFFIFLFFLGFT